MRVQRRWDTGGTGAAITRVHRDLRHHWREWTAITLLVGAAGAIVLTALTGARRTDTAYARYLRFSQAGDVLISPQNSGVTGFYDAVGRDRDVLAIAPAVGIEVFVKGLPSRGILAEAPTDTRLGTLVDRPKLLEGRWPHAGRADEAMAERNAARIFHLHAGSSLVATVAPTGPEGPDLARARSVTLRIVGIGVTRDDVVAINALAREPQLITTPAFLRQFDAPYYSFDGASVRLRPGASRAAFAARVDRLTHRFADTGGALFVADQHEQVAKIERAIRPQSVALGLFALLAGLAALLVLGQVLSRQLFLTSHEGATLRSLGMTRRQVFVGTLTEAGVAAAGGASLAALAAVLASPLMPIGPARVAEPHPGIAANWTVIGLGAVAIIALLLVRVAWPAWRLAGGQRRPQSAPDRSSRLAEGMAKAGAPLSTTVGLRLATDPGRGRAAVPVRTALFGTAMAVAAIAASLTFGTNLVRLLETPALYGQTWSLGVDTQFGSVAPGDVERILKTRPGVMGWTLGNHGDLLIGGHDTPAIGLARGRGRLLWPTVLEGRAPESPGEIMLGTKTLRASHRRVGQEVRVTLEGESSPRRLRIVGRGVFPFFGRGVFSPTGLGDGAAWFDPTPDPAGFNFVLVRTRSGPGGSAALAHLLRVIPKAWCPADQVCGMFTAQRPSDIVNFASVQSTPLALAAVLSVLAIATVAHLLVTSIQRRRRDFAVLKTLGFLRRQVSAAVAWQATFVALAALVIGIPAGVAAGRAMWLAFASRLGVAPGSHVPLATLFLAIPVALAIANAIAATPGWVAGRLRPAAVLRAE